MDITTAVFYWRFKLNTTQITFTLPPKSALPSEFLKWMNFSSQEPVYHHCPLLSPNQHFQYWVCPFIFLDFFLMLTSAFMLATMVSDLYAFSSLPTVPLSCCLVCFALCCLPCHRQRVLWWNTNLILSTPSLNLHWLVSAYTNHP